MLFKKIRNTLKTVKGIFIIKEDLHAKGNLFIPLSIVLIISILFSIFTLTNGYITSPNGEDKVLQFEVESEEDTLSEEAEEEIEGDIEALSPIFDEQTSENDNLSLFDRGPGKELLPLTGLLELKSPITHSDDALHIGFVTDTHVSSEPVGSGQGRVQKVFTQRISHIVQQMNDVVGVDFIVVNGDVIEGTKIPATQGIEELRQTKQLFDQTSIPKYWVLGNHDVRSVNKEQWKNALDIGYTYKSFGIKGYKVILLDSNFDLEGKDVSPGPGRAYTRGNISQEEIAWLKMELSGPEKKIVFLHHPPLRGIEKKPNIALLKNAAELREIFANGNVIGVFTGHIEDLYSEKDRGVRYFVFPGMTKSSEYPGNFVEIRVEDDIITAMMSYIGTNGEYVTLDIEEENIEIGEDEG